MKDFLEYLRDTSQSGGYLKTLVLPYLLVGSFVTLGAYLAITPVSELSPEGVLLSLGLFFSAGAVLGGPVLYLRYRRRDTKIRERMVSLEDAASFLEEDLSVLRRLARSAGTLARSGTREYVHPHFVLGYGGDKKRGYRRGYGPL